MTPALLRVMYAPIDYIHPHYFPTPTVQLSPALQTAVNHVLIERYALIKSIDFRLETRNFSEQVVANWKHVPKIAWLLGCKLARGSLALNGQLASLPREARSFIELPIACPAEPVDLKINRNKLELLGARYLYQLHSQLPAALGQRLELMFAPDMRQPLNGGGLNRSLLNFAFDHAKITIH